MTERIARLTTSAERAKLGSFAELFLELTVDAEWLTEVAALVQSRQGALRTLAQRLMRLYMSDFDANALTGMYRMLLLPEGAWQRLLGGRPGGRLLDVGAGSGDVTATLAPCFDEVEVTEVSRGMLKRLARHGFRCHAVDLCAGTPASLGAGPYDAVALLNVLDRCERPRTLLKSCQQALKADGILIVALALPYQPFYFAGPSTPEPAERLDCESEPGSDVAESESNGSLWEDAARRLLERELLPLGLSLERFARAPYLSAGDSKRELYELDDVVVLLRNRVI